MMTYLELMRDAAYRLERAVITLREYEEVIEPLRRALEQESVLDKIRAEITNIETCGQVDSHTSFIRTGEQVKNIAIGIVDKYRQEK